MGWGGVILRWGSKIKNIDNVFTYLGWKEWERYNRIWRRDWDGRKIVEMWFVFFFLMVYFLMKNIFLVKFSCCLKILYKLCLNIVWRLYGKIKFSFGL